MTNIENGIHKIMSVFLTFALICSSCISSPAYADEGLIAAGPMDDAPRPEINLDDKPPQEPAMPNLPGNPDPDFPLAPATPDGEDAGNPDDNAGDSIGDNNSDNTQPPSGPDGITPDDDNAQDDDPQNPDPIDPLDNDPNDDDQQQLTMNLIASWHGYQYFLDSQVGLSGGVDPITFVVDKSILDGNPTGALTPLVPIDPNLETSDSNMVPVTVTANGRGGGIDIRFYRLDQSEISPEDGVEKPKLFARHLVDGAFTNGSRITLLKNGNGLPNIAIAYGSGGSSRIKIISADGNVISDFISFPGFEGEVSIGSGDITGDGIDDIVVGSGAGTSDAHVKVFNGADGSVVYSFFPFPGFLGGVNVDAGGDYDGDGRGDFVVGAMAGAGPHVKVYSGASGLELASFYAYDQAFSGGVNVSIGDLDGDGEAEIGTISGAGANIHLKVFRNDGTEAVSFFAFDGSLAGGRGVDIINGFLTAGVDVSDYASAKSGTHVKVWALKDIPIVPVPPVAPPPLPVPIPPILPADPGSLDPDERVISSERITENVNLLHIINKGEEHFFLEVTTNDGRKLRYRVPPGNKFKAFEDPANGRTIFTHDGNGFPPNSVLALNKNTGQLFLVTLPGVQNSTTANVGQVNFPGGRLLNVILNNPQQNLLFDLLI